MLEFVKRIMVVIGVDIVGFVGYNAIKCVSMSNQECRTRPIIVNINSNVPLCYLDSTFDNKWGGSGNDINNPFNKLWVSDKIKDIIIKVFNLMTRTNETRYISWHELC